MDEKETSYAPFVDFEVKMDGENGIVDGYASVFEHRDHSKDRVLPGAFTKTLAERSKYIMYIPSHDYKVHVKDIPGVPLAVREDSKGLFTSTKFFLNTQAGRDSFTVIKEYQQAGKALGLSFTFRPTAGGSKMTSKGRDLSEVELFEYGHTALPMHDMARTISAKADSTTASNAMMHAEEVDHMHNHGDTIHSHPHTHVAKGGSTYGYDGMMASHSMHDHTADQMKSLVADELPKYWEYSSDTKDDDWEYESKRTFSQDERDKLAKEGSAMSDGSYPITDEASLKDAIQSVGRAKNYNAAKRHIIARARAMGKTDLLPEGWNVNKMIHVVTYMNAKDEDLLDEFELTLGRKIPEESSSKIRAALVALQDSLMQEEDVETSKNNEEVEYARKQKDEIEAALARIRI